MSNQEATVMVIIAVLMALVFSQIVSCERNSREMKAKCLINAINSDQVLKCKEIW